MRSGALALRWRNARAYPRVPVQGDGFDRLFDMNSEHSRYFIERPRQAKLRVALTVGTE